MSSLPPGLVLIIGALLFPLVRHNVQRAWLVALPVLSLVHLLLIPSGTVVQIQYMDHVLTPTRVDGLSMLWGVIFHVAALLSGIYAMHVKDTIQHVMGMMYAGAAVAAVFAGDLVSLFVSWELTAITSVFLVWATRSQASYRCGLRYLLIQVGSGVLLLAGIMMHVAGGGSLDFGVGVSGAQAVGVLINDAGHISEASLGVQLIFIAFGVKAAFPLLHNWLQDVYPQATPTGTVFLSAFTTKLAIYALARGFAGTECLVWTGMVMAIFPVFYAAIENDLRRVLAYSLNNQLGFMVCGIGLANFHHHPEVARLAINGVAAHAFAHILYKGLLFMSIGAVLHRMGTCKATDLRGLRLAESMPWTTVACIIGVLSIGAMPLFSGFVTKTMIIDVAVEAHHTWAWLALMVASAGMFALADLRVPYAAFFASSDDPVDAAMIDRGREAPKHMLVAMGVAAALCVLVGIYPKLLYGLLPFESHYHPYYDFGHVLHKAEMLFFATFAFAMLLRRGLLPEPRSTVNLDFDWFYRVPIPAFISFVSFVGLLMWDMTLWLVRGQIDDVVIGSRKLAAPRGVFGRTWTTGGMVIWAAILLGVYLLLYYVRVKG